METMNLGVRVTYRNNDGAHMYTKTYSLREYTEMLREDLFRLVTNVEDLCYDVNDGKEKEDWSEATFTAFNKIKHKLLDKAGEIGRIPDNLVGRISVPMNEAIKSLIDGAGDEHGESRMGS